MYTGRVKIIGNEKVAEGYYRMRLACPAIARRARPGQFVSLRVSGGCDPLLRRPFGVHRVASGQLDVLYEVVGPGTRLLAQRARGESLDIVGPLGNGFILPKRQSAARTVLVAGGMGVAPLLYLAQKLAEGQPRMGKKKPVVLIGAKTRRGILCDREFRALGCEVTIATDDGSRGFRGRVSDALNRFFSTRDRRPPTIFACGPHPMLQEVARIAARRSLDAQVSLEAHMACGIGACLGCVVRTVNGDKRVCKEGPVFAAHEIVW